LQRECDVVIRLRCCPICHRNRLRNSGRVALESFECRNSASHDRRERACGVHELAERCHLVPAS
jgi:hypothetical protein